MTFKNIFGSKFASTKDAPDDKSKAAPGSDKAAAKSKAAPAKAAPEKSS